MYIHIEHLTRVFPERPVNLLFYITHENLSRIMMLERYELLRRDFLSIAEPRINSDVLEKLKCCYTHDIDSKRKLSTVKNLKTLVRLLEKRDVISYDNIKELQNISKTFIGESNLESKLLDYESWLENTPLLPSCNMYKRDEVPISQKQNTAGRDLASTSVSNSPNNLPTQNSFNQGRTALQQTVLLQIRDRLGRSWRDVARYLGIRECEIDAVQSKHPYDLKEQCYEILNIYISQSDTEHWALNLIRALEKGRRKDLKELVEELVLKNKNT